MKRLMVKPEHEVAYQDMCKLISKHSDKLTGIELLAIAANMIGKLIAMQDQRKVTIEEIKQLVSANIEYGNKCMLDDLFKTKGNA